MCAHVYLTALPGTPTMTENWLVELLRWPLGLGCCTGGLPEISHASAITSWLQLICLVFGTAQGTFRLPERVHIETSMLDEFGQSIMRRKTDAILQEFARRVSQELAG